MTISIAMCTYNGCRYLADQLASIAGQSRLPDELVISDDDSIDETAAIARDFAAGAPFPVRVIEHHERVGVVSNFERAIACVSGDIVVLADQDDYWLPHKLASIERAFGDREIGLVFSDAEIVDEHLNPTGRRLWQYLPLTPAQRHRIEHGLAIDVLWPGWSVTGGTMAFRSKFREIALPIPRALQILHDGWIAAIVGSVARIRAIDEPLIKWRQHAAQQTGARERPQPATRWVTRLQVINAYAREIAITDRMYERVTSQQQFPLRPGAAEALRRRNRHARARASLSPRLVTRARAVFTELVSGRYHRFSTGLRSAAKDFVAGHRTPATGEAVKTESVPQSVRDRLASLVPPPGRMWVGDGDFLDTGFRFLRLFEDLGGLTPNARVLEIGCGIGRMAVPLTQYLSEEGSYDGFDIVGAGIQWCESHITKAHPRFRFRLVDLFNSVYNPSGTLDPERFDFPYPDARFDFIFLTSIFTHLLPDTVARYLAEIRRVSHRDGRCLMTAFLLNEESRRAIRRGLSSQVPSAHYAHHAVADERSPEAVVFYDEAHFMSLLAQQGFRLVHPVRYGTWSGRTSGNDYQDVLVVQPQ